MSAHQEFWERQFPRPVELTALPFDRPRPSVPSFLRDGAELDLPAQVREGLDALSARLDIPPLAIVLAAVETVLFRYTGQETSVIGVCADRPDSSELRSRHASELLPIQLDWSSLADVSGEALALTLARSLAEASSHADYPLRDLQSRAGARDAAFGARLFNVALRLDSVPGDREREDDLTEFLTACDVVITATCRASGLNLRVEYDSDLFEPATVGRMLGHIGMILCGLFRDSSTEVLRLPLITSSERHHLVVERHAGGARFASTETLHGLFEAQAERAPDRTALTCDGVSVTYGELNERANRLARRLIESGVGPDTLVGLCVDRSNELVVALLAILKAGGAYLPIDLAYPADRLAFMLEDAQAPVLLTETKLMASLPPTRATVLCVDDIEARPVRDGDEANLQGRAGSNNLAYVIYTSGTTGKPKGALITHANVTRLFHATRELYDFDERDVWTLFHSVAFDFSVWEIWGALLYGGRVVVVPFVVSRSPEAFYQLLVAERVTVLNQTPSAFQQLIQAEESVGPMDVSLRYVIFGGESLEMRSLKAWFDRHGDERPMLVNMYGITETTVHVTYRRLSKDDVQSGSVIGTPIPDLQVYMLNQHRELVPVGVAGEMYVGGAGLSRGYLNRPDLTTERFVPDDLTGQPGRHLYRTGDLARILTSGDIEYLGRIDHQVKIRGFRIELGEIESVLCQVPSVREAVVMAREDEPGTKRLVAYVRAGQSPVDVSELREHLRQKVPAYMVPAAFVLLDVFPLTASGKIDRKALPAPSYDRRELHDRYIAPQTPAEKALVAIWSKVLRLAQVGTRDNFFELGGDSILGIQVTSLARREGLLITPQLLFANPTIAGLAEAASFEKEFEPSNQEAAVTGDVPLTPIQRWFFEQELEEPHHYNQSFLFDVTQRVERSVLERALAEVARHHDALRLRFRRDNETWRQFYGEPGEVVPFVWTDLASMPAAQRAHSIETAASTAQSSLDLENGPVWRAVYFDMGTEVAGKLLIVVHHLAIDGVSWRPLLEDLEVCCRQIEEGQIPQLPPKTTSFQVWGRQLEQYAETDSLRTEVAYWQMVTDPGRAGTAASAVDILPSNTEASCRTLKVALAPNETDALLQQVPLAYNTQINDVLLTALARAWCVSTGSSFLFTNLEGHGREYLLQDMDLSRTVGWFTSIFPVRLELPRVQDQWEPGAALKAIKEQLRQVPRHGIGYGVLRYLCPDTAPAARQEPSIVFNYFGQFDQIVAASRLFRFGAESTGPWHGPRQRRRHQLELNSLVIDGRLELWLTYSENLDTGADVRKLSEGFLAALKDLIAHCLSPEAGGRTPSDFPLARLDQAALDHIVAGRRDVEDVYPLSPIQTLFYSANPGAVLSAFDQWRCTLRGDLDVAAFQRAWLETLRRHAVLRSTIHGDGLREPMQVVHRDVQPSWTIEDWRNTPANEHADRWDSFLKRDRATPLSLTEAPVMRFTLLRLAGNQWKFLWSVPALLLDGWSWPLVFRDASRLYEAFAYDGATHLEPVRPYRDYLEWLGRQSFDEARAFWRTTLAGFREPASVSGEPAERASGDGRHAERRYAKHVVQLSPDTTRALQMAARGLHLTLNTLVQGAWAVILGRQSQSADVVFGAAFGGRPTDLHGAESIVGPLVNNLPVRVTVDPESSVGEFLRAVHRRLLQLQANQFLPLMEIQRVSEVPWRYRLFESVVVFQNYLVDDSARSFGGDIDIADFVGPIHTNYPVMLLAEPGGALRLTLIYDQQTVAHIGVERWGRDLALMMEQIPACLETRLASLQEQLSSPSVARVRLRQRIRVESQNYVPPQSEMEKAIAGVWQTMFGVDRVGVEENFFDLGGHSLLLVQMHGRLRDSLKAEFPIVTLFEHPTVRSLARYLEEPVASSSASGHQWRDRAERQRQALAQMRTKSKKEGK